MFNQIIKKTFTVGCATLISRVFGFLRDILIAFFFGLQDSAQAFVVAFRLPNIWRSFIGEEAVNAAVVPVLSEYQSKQELNKFWELSLSLFKFSLLILSVITLFGIAFAPLLVKVIAPGFVSNFQKYSLCVKLTRLIFPYILLIGLTAIVSGVVIAQKIFWSYSWAPVILNLTIIFSLLFIAKIYGVYALALGIVVGGILELVLQFFALKKVYPVKVKAKIFHPEYKRIMKLLLPRFLGAGIYQINIFVDTILASLENIVGYGGIAALYYAQRFVQLPLAVFATSMATAVLPFFSEQATNKTIDKLSENVCLSLRSVFFIIVPASFGLIALGKEIIATFLQYGEFTIDSTEITAQALQFYALGLFFYAGIKILVSTFYSLQDTLTPVKVSLISLFINVVLSIILMFPLKLAGLCLATSISAGYNFFMLFRILGKTLRLSGKEILKSFVRIIFSTLFMFGLLLVMKDWLFSVVKIKGLNLFILMFIALFSYLVASLIFNPKELKAVLTWRRLK